MPRPQFLTTRGWLSTLLQTRAILSTLFTQCKSVQKGVSGNAYRGGDTHKDWGLTPALELLIGEQGAVVTVSACDCGRSQVRAQRDGGKEVAHLVGVVDVNIITSGVVHKREWRLVAGVATSLGVAEAQLAVAVAPCRRGRQDRPSGLRSPAKLWFQSHCAAHSLAPPHHGLALHIPTKSEHASACSDRRLQN